MALLSGDEETFRAAVDAYRAQDGESMQMLLARHALGARCEVVCHWLRSKECVLLCLELAGPPPLEEEPPAIVDFAEVVAKVSEDEELVELIAAAVQERDADAWAALVKEQGLERFSHLLCHWACTVHYRLVCSVVCQPGIVKRPELIPELRAAGQAIGRLAADGETFAAAVDAVSANDCGRLASTLEGAGFVPFCHLICEWFCSWRCMLVCLRLCRAFPIERPESPIEEMLEFARAGGRLAAEGGVLGRLSAAMLREDFESVQSLVKEFEFERFCIQFCHWVCFLRCQRFCVCVCPPRTIALFTHIGALNYATDVHSQGRAAGDPIAVPPAPPNSGDGLTIADHRAFFETLRLNGGLSLVDGAPLIEYRFETIATTPDGEQTGTWQPVTPAQIAPTEIGSFIRFIPAPPFIETIKVSVNDPSAGFNIAPSADGWIKVPPMFPVPPMVPPGPGWQFSPGGDTAGLINLITTTLTPFVASIDETGITASVSANAPLQTDVHYGVRMRIRDQGTVGGGTEAGTCGHIALNNTRYEKIAHHPYWPGGLFQGPPFAPGQSELAVASVGIAELAAAPCSELTNSLTVQFTAAHSHLGAVTVSLEGPGTHPAFDLVPATAQAPGENWFGTASPNGWTFADLPPCAYLLDLSVVVLLTTGDAVPDALVDHIAFCKGAS
ncbi:MAG: hypothetical protein M3065_07365 [Actinomycetota bacterium]|nr:hypothetical protein [Actinomycetota bacterium]